jgi:hypothetical protein
LTSTIWQILDLETGLSYYYLCETIAGDTTPVVKKRKKSEIKAVGSTSSYQDFFIWQAIVRGQSVSTEGPFLFSGLSRFFMTVFFIHIKMLVTFQALFFLLPLMIGYGPDTA